MCHHLDPSLQVDVLYSAIVPYDTQTVLDLANTYEKKVTSTKINLHNLQMKEFDFITTHPNAYKEIIY